MPDKIDWSEYYDMTRNQPPRDLLVEALLYVKNIGKAIDIGAGALSDVRYLLLKGFDVTAIDNNPILEKEAKEINNERLHPFVVSLEDHVFLVNEYDLVSAMYSLHYCDPQHFDHVIMNIKSSLKNGGIFCGQMFGAYDDWSQNLPYTYLKAEEARQYLNDMEIISFREQETENGRTKHWHIYDFIARKR